MSPEAQQIAIAEACGAVDVIESSMTAYWPLPQCHKLMMCSDEVARSDERPGYIWAIIPHFLRDLNAIHEAEKVLTEEQQLEYWLRLAMNARPDPNRGYWFLLHATAAQRAEAFLRAIGKWGKHPKELEGGK